MPKVRFATRGSDMLVVWDQNCDNRMTPYALTQRKSANGTQGSGRVLKKANAPSTTLEARAPSSSATEVRRDRVRRVNAAAATVVRAPTPRKTQGRSWAGKRARNRASRAVLTSV